MIFANSLNTQPTKMRKNIFSTFVFLLSINTLFAQVTTGIYINEIMASNDATIADNTGDYTDWVELYNSNSSSVDLANYYLSDSPTNLTKFRFTSTTGQVVIPANGRLIIWASGFPARGVNHTTFSLSDAGEAIVLTAPNGTTIIDGFSFGKQRTDVSYGRLPDGGIDFKYFLPASPNASNSSANAYNEILASPTYSHTGGFYSTPFSLTISHPDPNVVIYYTNDGSIPSESNLSPQINIYKNAYPLSQNDPIGPLLYDRTYQSNLYNSPLTINDRSNEPNFVSQVVSTYDTAPTYLPSYLVDKGTIVRAIAYKAGALPSDVTTHTFFFSPTGTNKYTFPIISLGIQENHLFNYYDGIYVAGITFDNMIQQGYFNQCVGNFSNLDQERPASFEMIVGSSSVLSQPVGIKIHGGCTKAFRLKSLNVYGKDDFNYDLFPNKPGVYHRNLILRNSGQDAGQMLFRDALYQNMVRHFRIDVQDYNPAVIFINGEYWGIENIREKHDKHFISKTYGTNADSLDIIEVPGFIDSEEGDLVHFNNMVSYIQNNSLANTTNFEYAKTLIDIDSFMDYMIAEIYSTNTDWPHNNVRLWRKRTTQYLPNAPYGQDGRWRWMLLDMDFTLGFGKTSDFDGIDYATQFGNEFKDIFRKLLENTSFRNAFINRFADFLNTAFLPSRTSAMLDAAKLKYAPEVEQHIRRWISISSYATWESNIENTRQFLLERPAYQRTHIRTKWDISGLYNLTVDVSDAAHGYVRVNTIDIVSTTPGVSTTPYPWTGSYFNNIPIQIRPIAKEGYKFKHWIYNSAILTDSVQTINVNTAQSYTAVFELYIISPNPEPTPANLDACNYTFKSWAASSAIATSPASMKFVYMVDSDPPVTSSIAGFTSGAFNLTSRTRINGLGISGFSFINTGNGNTGYPSMKLGGAILAINTTDKSKVTVSWIGRTIIANSRVYRIRLQYRIGDIQPFNDLLDDNGQVVEYVRGADGSNLAMPEVSLPSEVLNQPYVQLLWRYYYTGVQNDINSGARDELGIDDIMISAESTLSGNSVSGAIQKSDARIYTSENLNASTIVNYEASKAIILNPGFKIEPSTTFTASIIGCQ